MTPGTEFLNLIMIRSFRNKGLEELFVNGNSRKIGKRYHKRALRRLDVLQQAVSPEEINIPGFDFHILHGKPRRYSIHVNGNYCITFSWDGEHAIDVDFEDYH